MITKEQEKEYREHHEPNTLKREKPMKDKKDGHYTTEALQETMKKAESLEIWKNVKGYEGLYLVSNRGRIRTLQKHYRGKKYIKA